MSKRNPVSAKQNIYFDSQLIDDTNLNLEQNYNTTVLSGVINNNIGSGVVPEVLTTNVLFDSSLSNGYLDGKNIQTQSQPTDNNYGNQLSITLSDSLVAGKKSVKFCVIGLDFQNELQYEIFYFKRNETQVTTKHYTKILVLLFNDFVGTPTLSLNLGGKIVITEAKAVTLSRDVVMLAQDVQPNLFFRDFFVDGFSNLTDLLTTALPYYNVDSLGITTTQKESLILTTNDVTTQIGQKFKATTNNIQKISLLLSVQNTVVGQETDLAWTGDFIISIYPLQTSVTNPYDIAPDLDIDFSPVMTPIAQLSFNYLSLQSAGTTLDGVPQVVDFVFSNSSTAVANGLNVGKYYAFTVKRSGSANKCDILLSAGGDKIADSRVTTFASTLWVDLPDDDLWFRIFTDAAKVSDGQAYDSGNGVIIPKIQTSSSVSTDFCLNKLPFTGGDIYTAVLAASSQGSEPVLDSRTGNPINSVQEFVPKVSLLNTISLTSLENATDPLLLGNISDKNIKFYDSISARLTSSLHGATIVDDTLYLKVITDSTDPRYDTSMIALKSDLLNGNLINAKITPNSSYSNLVYRIAKAELLTMILGDVNGDGVVDSSDFILLNTYLNYNFNTGLALNTTVTTDSIHTTYVNGYATLTVPFTSDTLLTFQLVDPATNLVMASGADGVLVASPTDNRLCNFTSSSVDFSTFPALDTYKIVIITSVVSNHGGFSITQSASNVLTLQKINLNQKSVEEMLRADINNDLYVGSNDGYLLSEYIDRVSSLTNPSTSYPAPSTNAFDKIGHTFEVIKLTVEKFSDRIDDYASTPLTRSTTIHTSPDLYIDGYAGFVAHNFSTPITVYIDKQLSWEESLVVANSSPKLIPVTYSNLTVTPADVLPVVSTTYPETSFSTKTNDFFFPKNIIIGEGGQIKNEDGSYHKEDLEISTIVLEVPPAMDGYQKYINLMDAFVADYTGTGKTRKGFKALKFADNSYASTSALSNNQLRFAVSLQAFSPNNDGYSDGYGAIVDGRIGVNIDYSTGLLSLNFTNLYEDAVYQTLTTKVQVTVYLKKAGFLNSNLFVNSTQVANLFV